MSFYATITRERLDLDDWSPAILTFHATDSAPSLEKLQGIVGGLIEPLFTVNRPGAKPHHMITGYANEEGNYMVEQLGPGARIREARYAPYDTSFVGPMVIVGLNYKTGESIPLSWEDVKWLREQWDANQEILSV